MGIIADHRDPSERTDLLKPPLNAAERLDPPLDLIGGKSHKPRRRIGGKRVLNVYLTRNGKTDIDRRHRFFKNRKAVFFPVRINAPRCNIARITPETQRMRNLSRVPVVGVYNRPFRLCGKERIRLSNVLIVRIAIRMIAVGIENQRNLAMKR